MADVEKLACPVSGYRRSNPISTGLNPSLRPIVGPWTLCYNSIRILSMSSNEVEEMMGIVRDLPRFGNLCLPGIWVSILRTRRTDLNTSDYDKEHLFKFSSSKRACGTSFCWAISSTAYNEDINYE